MNLCRDVEVLEADFGPGQLDSGTARVQHTAGSREVQFKTHPLSKTKTNRDLGRFQGTPDPWTQSLPQSTSPVYAFPHASEEALMTVLAIGDLQDPVDERLLVRSSELGHIDLRAPTAVPPVSSFTPCHSTAVRMRLEAGRLWSATQLSASSSSSAAGAAVEDLAMERRDDKTVCPPARAWDRLALKDSERAE